ncbi:hypothetical protein [Parvibaculum sp.]|uniref:hypothetical protein n=1 Tax=Parvibaculum sp. TaxID=2024848 RepID=UPI001D2BB24C|nr:hypothetical protein [Parvibaculum sp.]MBX3489702.1 hypothetical protein [Parvibaculum sp.]MCW5726340.1 hypothetical protein [Parvibaculum sp.]
MPRPFDEPGEPHLTISDSELMRLEEEIPILAGLRAFAEEAVHMPWFSKLGRPLDAETRALARSWLDGLGFPDAEVARLRDWSEAADAAATLDFDPVHWEAEEGLRASLSSDALERLSEDGLTIAMTHVSALLGERIGNAVRDAAAFWEVEDEELLNAAAGAALHAAHGAALALIVEADADHPFRRKFSLFTRGRWPIGIAGLTLNIF